MATKTIVSLQDDIDGTEAAETIRFSLGTTDFEIDLSSANIENLHDVLTPFIEAARVVPQRRAGRSPDGTRKPVSRSPAGRKASSEIRAWAKEEGIDISERGRIPASVVDQYEARKKK